MISYKELNDSLEERIQELEKRTALLAEARSEKTPISKINFTKINRKTDELEPEEIALILQSKHESRVKKGVSYEPILLKDEKDIEIFNNLLQELPKDKPFHFDIIIQQPNSLHCTPLQIHSDGQEVRIFSVDAFYGSSDKIKTMEGQQVDLTNSTAIKLFENTLNTTANIYTAGELQKDFMSCSIFSVQDLNSMSNIGVENLSQYLTPSNSTITENDSRRILHPRFMKNAQSMSTIEQYIKDHSGKQLFVDKKSQVTLQEHLENHSINVETATTVEDANGATKRIKTVKKVNRSIDEKTLKYLKAAQATLQRLYQEGGEPKVQECIEARTGHKVFESFFYEGLTAEQINKVQGIYDKNAIKLVLNYGISKEQLEESNCHQNKKTSEKVLNIIKSHCEDAPNKTEKAKEMFDQVKSFTEAQLAAVKCGLDINLVTNSEALQSKNWIDGEDQNNTKDSLLLLAIRNQELQTTQALTTQGANLHARDINGNTSLHLAASTGDTLMIKFLLDNGLNLESKNNIGQTPLAMANNRWKPNAVTTLLEAGANPQEVTNKQFTPEAFEEKSVVNYFKKAIDNENTEALQNLAKHHPDFKQTTDETSKTKLLNYALEEKKHDMAALMILEGFQHKQPFFQRLVGGKKDKTPDQIAESIGGETLAKYKILKEAKFAKQKEVENQLKQTPTETTNSINQEHLNKLARYAIKVGFNQVSSSYNNPNSSINRRTRNDFISKS